MWASSIELIILILDQSYCNEQQNLSLRVLLKSNIPQNNSSAFLLSHLFVLHRVLLHSSEWCFFPIAVHGWSTEGDTVYFHQFQWKQHWQISCMQPLPCKPSVWSKFSGLAARTFPSYAEKAINNFWCNSKSIIALKKKKAKNVAASGAVNYFEIKPFWYTKRAEMDNRRQTWFN